MERLTSASRPKRLIFFKKKAEKGGCYITQRSIKIKSEPLGLSLSSWPKNPLNPKNKEKKYQLERNNVWETVCRTKSNLPITFRSIRRKPSKKFPWPSLKGKEERRREVGFHGLPNIGGNSTQLLLSLTQKKWNATFLFKSLLCISKRRGRGQCVFVQSCNLSKSPTNQAKGDGGGNNNGGGPPPENLFFLAVHSNGQGINF